VNVGFIHIIDKVLNIPSNMAVIINEAHLSGLAQVASELHADPRLTALLANESELILYAYDYLSPAFAECFCISYGALTNEIPSALLPTIVKFLPWV
jgi:hypothetical protein